MVLNSENKLTEGKVYLTGFKSSYNPEKDKEQYTFQFDPSACEACGGHCCTGESGYIWAKYEEIEKMAEFVLRKSK